MLFRWANNEDAASLASRFRRERVRRFVELVKRAESAVRILDVGGTAEFWVRYRQELPARVSITLMNHSFEAGDRLPWLTYAIGDACRLTMFRDREFDICFSNSVIEHVGGKERQRKMASEIRRVARGYYVQTPNFYFPMEPHFLVLGWQFAPLALRASLLQRRDWGWIKRVADADEARKVVESIQLLRKTELQTLFPDGRIEREKFGLLTKAFIAWRPIM